MDEELEKTQEGEVQEAPSAEAEVPYSQKMLAKMKERYPERDLESDPEAVYQAMHEYDEERGGQLGRYAENENRQREMFLQNPKAAAVYASMAEGADPIFSIIENFGEDILSLKDDPEKKDEFVKKQQAYLDKLAQSKQIEEQQQENMTRSIGVIEDFCKSKGMTDDEQEGFFTMIVEDAQAVFMCNYTPEMLERQYKGSIYDQDLQDAYDMGKTDGIGEKIHIQTKKTVGDGMPTVSSAPTRPGGNAKPTYNRPRSHFDNLQTKA